MKETIIIYLLIISFSLKNAIEFGEKIYFIMKNNNNKFEFKFTEDGSLFIQIDGPWEEASEIMEPPNYGEHPEFLDDQEDRDDRSYRDDFQALNHWNLK